MFIEGSSVAEASWTTSPLEAAADEGREAYGSSVLGCYFPEGVNPGEVEKCTVYK